MRRFLSSMAFTALLAAQEASAAVASWVWHPAQSLREAPSLEVFPVGQSIFPGWDAAARLTASRELGLDAGLQTTPEYSSWGFYAGLRTDWFRGTYGAGATVRVTALVLNFAADYAYLDGHRFGLSAGLGVPWIWFNPGRE